MLEPLAIEGELYERLIRAVLYQQLSGKAAATIHGRFLTLFPTPYPAPDRLIRFTAEELRVAGVSKQKAGYLQHIARHFLTHDWLQRDWTAVDDATIIHELTAIKGVGQWTVEMLLMFTLGREDILPLGDLGVQNAMKDLYQLTGKSRELARQQQAISLAWQPYRSWACRYLWRYQDGALAK